MTDRYDCSCGQSFEWKWSFDFEDVICPHCAKVYIMEYDETYDEQDGENYYMWLEPKSTS